jgi:Na+/H+ antiporter NhaD/arsenite permease-like protein
MGTPGADTPQFGVWALIAVVAYFAFRLTTSVRAEERRRREQGQPHTARDTALLLLSALFVVGLLLCAMFLKPLNSLINSRAGIAAIILVGGGGLTYVFNRRRTPDV